MNNQNNENSTPKPEPKISQLEQKEEIRIAYQSLPQMVAIEGQKPWNALSVFIQLAFVLAAGAIVPSFLPVTNNTIIALVGFGLSLSGIFASIIWISFDKRYRKMVRYWILSTRELEEKMSDSVIAFQRGNEFAAGNKIEVSGETLQYKNIERISVRSGFLIIYLVFLAVFILLALYNVFRLLQALNIF